jgi:hypothetical protein
MRIRNMASRARLAALFVCIAIYLLSNLISCTESGKKSTSKVFLGSEEARVTSPNGQLDAVIIREDGGGAAGGWEWYVYIVGKGSRVDEGKLHPVFNAGTLTGEKLVWHQDHLLEIYYDVADINQFRNLWGSYEIDGKGASEPRSYTKVEIRLVPSQPDFSLLGPYGEFRPKN